MLSDADMELSPDWRPDFIAYFQVCCALPSDL